MLGFVGLGVMGAPMCRNLAAKSRDGVRAYDADLEALAQMDQPGVIPVESIREVAERADVVFLALPGGPQVEAVCLGAGSLLTHLHPGACVVDLSTTPVNLARELEARFSARGIQFADAPVARTREAAQEGTLLAMVGASDAVFKRVKPLLEHMASDIVHCGGPGAGQAMKLVNNLVLFQNVVALAEGFALIRHAGIDPARAFAVLTQGSADSFALRNHGMKAMLPGQYPEHAFSSEYALKDIRYALRFAEEAGLFLSGADNTKEVIKRAIRAGFAKEYFPALAKVIKPAAAPAKPSAPAASPKPAARKKGA